MESWVLKILEEYGYFGIFVLKMLENLFPPIPSEVILTIGGFMTTYTDLSIVGIIIFSTLGSVSGAAILYGIGLLIDIHKVEKVLDKWGYLLRLKREDFHRANAWFSKYGVWTVFFCRFIPVIRSLISIPAGMFRMNFVLFLLLTFLGTFIWNVTLVNVGSMVGDSWGNILSYNFIYSKVFYVILGIIIILLVVVYIKFKKKRSSKPSEN